MSVIRGRESNERNILLDEEGLTRSLETVTNMSKSFQDKLNNTFTYIKEFQINNSTFNETLHIMTSFVSHLMENVNESFFSVVNVLKDKLTASKQHAKELISNAKKQASEQFETLQKKLDED